MNPFEIPDFIERYARDHTSEEDALLRELERETYLHTLYPQMLSGKVQGTFLGMLSQMISPKYILEIGTFTGYSAYCLAKGLNRDGKLFTCEVNDELEERILSFFRKAKIDHLTELIIGDARKEVPKLEYTFDLVFIDGNKEHYIDYYNVVIDKVKSGGFIIVDNVLWGGKVTAPKPNDLSSIHLDKFNRLITNDLRVENLFLTLRDGLMLIKKH